MGWTHDSPGPPDMGLDWGLSTGWDRTGAPHRAPGSGTALEEELAPGVNEVLDAHRAVDTDAIREIHAALGNDVGLDVALDTDRVQRVAAVEDTDQALTSSLALGEDTAAEQDVGMDRGQGVGIDAAAALDFGPDTFAGGPAWGSRGKKSLSGTWDHISESSLKCEPEDSHCYRWAPSGAEGCSSYRSPKSTLMTGSRCSKAQTVVVGSSCGRKAAAGEQGGIWWSSASDAVR